MKNFIKMLVLLVSLAISNGVVSAPVSQNTAKTVAFNFIKNIDSKVTSSSVLSLVYTRESAFYVFGHANGFIIIAADDRVTPIFGYSTESIFVVPENESDTIRGNNFWGWMKSLEDQISYVTENNISATDAIDTQWSQLISNHPPSRSTTTVVPPLLTTTWDQVWPYNSMCPSDPSGPGGHVYTGCVATAMAQILKHHNYPSQGLGSYGYTWGGYPYTGANFGTTTYNWSNMPNSIATENTDLATLIYQTAVSCRSMWGAGETGVGYSGGQDPMTRAFVNYFKMAYSSISYVGKGDDAEWHTLIQGELLANRPVYYRGDGVGSHAWVCDGVDASNMYHFNFGWGGQYNGYYLLTSINPGSNNFTNNQHAIIGIKSNDGSTLVTNTTWTGTQTKSTNICVPDAVTLTVSPGATISFAPGCKLQVFGRLLSTGTSTNYTKFTAINTNSGWEGIKWDNDYMLGEVMADNDSSTLIYTQVEYSQRSGIYCMQYGKLILDHCKINNNYCYSGASGAGVCAIFSPISITNCEIYNNHATNGGGGISLSGTGNLSSNISHNDIHDNVSDAEGGGVVLGNTNVNVILNNNTIHHNQAILGAGIYIWWGNPTIVNNKICNNTSPAIPGYGALYIENSTANIASNLIANNAASGIYVRNASPTIINSTIVNNHNYYTSGIIFDEGSDASVKNCIVYGNEATNPAYGIQIQIWDNNSDPYFDYCDIQGGIGGFGGPGSGANYTTGNYTNNIDVLPQFVAPSAGAGTGYDGLTANWQLQSSSPCIDAGDITGISNLLPALDLAGNPRINGVIDMGAYEYVCVPVPVSVSIVADQNPVCSGTTVTFTATPGNGGSTPSYQWKKNGSNVGTNLPTYSVVPINGDIITCILTSNLTCITGNPATSNAITMIVNTSLPVSIAIVADNNSVCAGTTVTYTATPTNGGTSPTYQWKKNGSNVGTNLPTYSYIPANNDVITCVLTSNLTCTTGNPATSNAITMTVNTNLPVSVSIVADQNPVCSGTTVTFTATPGNGGSSPSYQWKKNGSNVGTNLPTYSVVPINSDVITCVLTSNLTCTTGNPATSNAITMIVNVLPIANAGNDQSINYGTSTTLNGSASGGSGNYTFSWEPAAMLINPNIQNPTTIQLTASVVFTLTVSDASNGCIGTDQVVITVTGGPLAVDASASPTSICLGETSQLTALVSGGSGNYTFSWTSTPAGFISTLQNPMVSPIITTTYTVAVYDGNTTVSDGTQVDVNYLPEQASPPVGPENVDLHYVTTSEYTTSPIANTDYYTWILEPSTMGTISGNGTNITISWSGSLGEVTLSVKAVNACGEGLASEPLAIHVDNSVGVDDLSHTDITLYPNPSNGIFFITASEQLSEIIIFDQMGKCLSKVQRPNDGCKYDYSHYPPGVYVVHIIGAKTTTVKKIIITH